MILYCYFLNLGMKMYFRSTSSHEDVAISEQAFVYEMCIHGKISLNSKLLIMQLHLYIALGITTNKADLYHGEEILTLRF